MSTLNGIIKRALNVAFIGCLLWSAFVAVAGILGISRARMNWGEWFIQGVLVAVAGYAALAVLSYVFFGRVTFWHKPVS